MIDMEQYRAENGRLYGFDPKMGFERILKASLHITGSFYTKVVKIKRNRICTFCHTELIEKTNAFVICINRSSSLYMCEDTDTCLYKRSVRNY